MATRALGASTRARERAAALRLRRHRRPPIIGMVVGRFRRHCPCRPRRPRCPRRPRRSGRGQGPQRIGHRLTTVTQHGGEAASVARVVAGEEGLGQALLACAAGAADAVHVLVRVHIREVIVDDRVDAGHVEAPGRNVGGDEQREPPCLEACHRGLALRLRSVAAEDIDLVAGGSARFANLPHESLGVGEDDEPPRAAAVTGEGREPRERREEVLPLLLGGEHVHRLRDVRARRQTLLATADRHRRVAGAQQRRGDALDLG